MDRRTSKNKRPAAKPKSSGPKLSEPQRLCLLRHAKSSRDDSDIDDHDRPLAARGRSAAALIAEHLLDSGLSFDLVLCSSSLRTRETLDAILSRMSPSRVILERKLYLASAASLLERLRALGEEDRKVLMVGHNPGLHELALALADSRSLPGLPSLSGKFPTGALAIFDLNVTWSALGPRCAKLAAYKTPRDLEAE